ncbi:MAG: twin-arginine translocase TatA/TatE family subunit [Coriobacteriia bacterium]|nr:twin-arginine translocase TatA/TatE family subunit [Coriobacteriia bacterium]
MAAFGIPGGMELWIILGIVLLLFGPSQLPKLAKMFGKSAKALKEGMDEGMSAIDDDGSAKKSESTESTDKGSDS